LGQPLSICQELKRRNVIRVGAAYVVGAWLLIQVTETIFPLFGFDDTPARFVVVILAIGFIPALALQRTGADDRAAELIGETMALIQNQVEEGIVIGPHNIHLQFNLGQLHAMVGEQPEAIESLRSAATQGGLTCAWCLRLLPHFDKLRDNPAFEALIVEQEAKLATQRQRLNDEGMLLTPAEVLQLDSFSFDPFAD